MLQKSWRDLTLVAFDTETTGKYPLTAEICEIAAVKYRGGEVVDTYSTLLKPAKPMGDAVIAIHGITNEMVANAPLMSEKIRDVHAFFADSILIAHHAPFDLGFVSIEFERAGLSLPQLPIICSSLLSRKLMPESPDHRLQTLIGHLGLEKGTAHRALDDAKACLQVAVKCFERMSETALEHAVVHQGASLSWDRFSMKDLEEKDTAGPIVQASREGGEVEFTYDGGSKPGGKRRIFPVGVVRSLDGDFFVGVEPGQSHSKRFFLDKVTSAKRVIG
jgi:DNA polymerase-3 subunit epsilon